MSSIEGADGGSWWLTKWLTAYLTRKRSLVRTQYRPQGHSRAERFCTSFLPLQLGQSRVTGP